MVSNDLVKCERREKSDYIGETGYQTTDYFQIFLERKRNKSLFFFKKALNKDSLFVRKLKDSFD